MIILFSKQIYNTNKKNSTKTIDNNYLDLVRKKRQVALSIAPSYIKYNR